MTTTTIKMKMVIARRPNNRLSSSSSFSGRRGAKRAKQRASSNSSSSSSVFVSKNDDDVKDDDDDEISETTRRIARRIRDREENGKGGGGGGAGTQALGAGGQTTIDGLKRVDGIWKRIRSGSSSERREFVKTITTTTTNTTSGGGGGGTGTQKFDVVVCGGTLGILLAATLQQKENGLKVAVIERGKLRGREQEWNVTRKELSVLCALNVLTKEDLDEVICGEFNPIKCGFYDSSGKRRKEENEITTENVLNCGVSPTKLIEKCRKNFESNGGVVLENTSLNGVTINEEDKNECARLDIGSETLEARLVVDAMGFGSPITLQARNGEKPDGVCVVVGTCAEGFDEAKNDSADLIYTCTDIEDERQYFWEAFPAELDRKNKSSNTSNVRTTYMFSYLDAKPERPSIARILDDYWNLMPKYQNLNSLDDVEFKRMLFGYFPTYRNSPLKAQFDRILQIGDASGMQSPLSFGGLACMLRHLPRISLALTEALEADIVDKEALGTINAYQPALSAAWLFQRCMSVQVGSSKSPLSSSKTFINDLMRINFGVMQNLGDDVLKPFLQDVIRFKPLTRTLLSMTKNNITFVPSILLQSGVEPIVDWFRHFVALGAYDALEPIVDPGMRWAKNTNALSARSKFLVRRYLEAIEYGAGNDSVDKEIQRRLKN
jgi:flavin-dependent dehydrogenase